jgi:hypothetical protein
MIQWRRVTPTQRLILGALRTRAETDRVLVGDDELPTTHARPSLQALQRQKLVKCVSRPTTRNIGVYRITLAGLNLARARNLT